MKNRIHIFEKVVWRMIQAGFIIYLAFQIAFIITRLFARDSAYDNAAFIGWVISASILYLTTIVNCIPAYIKPARSSAKKP